MKHSFLYPLSLVLVVCLTSCTNVAKVQIAYLTPGSDGIAMASGAKIKIVSRDTPLALQVKAGIERSFSEIADRNVEKTVKRAETTDKHANLEEVTETAKAAQLRITDLDPDYWMFISIRDEHREDSPEEAEYNYYWEKVVVENDFGGNEKLERHQGSITSSTSAIVNISLYSRHGLLPIHEIQVANWDSGEPAKFYAGVVKQVAARITDGLQTMDRKVPTLIPSHIIGSPLVQALEKNDDARIKNCLQQLNLKPFDEFLIEINMLLNKHDNTPFKAMSMELSNYYLAMLDFERNHLDTRSLRLAQECYLTIMKASQDAGLSKSCADSLARVEKKLVQLSSVKL